MVINTNISAQSGARLLAESQNLLARSLARLSSGSRLVSPDDDVAGQGVALRFSSQISRITAARTNIQNAISLNQTQDGFLQKVGKALDRMSELAIMAQDVTKSDADRALYNEEFRELASYVEDLAGKKFNDVTLFDGTNFQVTTDSDGTKFTTTGVDMTTTAYTNVTDSGTTIDTVSNANTALGYVKTAITQLATDRAGIGANISVLKSYGEQLGVLRDNLTQARSRIMDVDVAEESAEYAKAQILVQAGTAMLAQANTLPQIALRLLG